MFQQGPFRMSGKILIVDDIATNRIVLRVKLSSAFYTVIQASSEGEALKLAQADPPDLAIVSATLPEGGAMRLATQIRALHGLADLPVLVTAPQLDEAQRMALLASGVDDIIEKPYDDLFLQARLRNLVRARVDIPRSFQLAESPTAFEHRARILLAAENLAPILLFRSALEAKLPHRILPTTFTDLPKTIGAGDPADAVILLVSPENPGVALRLLSEVRTHARTRHAATLVLFQAPFDAAARNHALDLGAWAAVPFSDNIGELALRLTTLLSKKRLADLMRASVQSGLQAALFDPLTGAHNRRYALPRLETMLQDERRTGAPMAMMVADLDHFKQINDSFGHTAGDHVLIELCKGFSAALGPRDLFARIGGEEFLLALPDCQRTTASLRARAFCERVRTEPFALPGTEAPAHVTISIGVAVLDPALEQEAEPISSLLNRADRALYGAKTAGRDNALLSAAPPESRLSA